jgi:tetraacyldisaccharide 4'-kinase
MINTLRILLLPISLVYGFIISIRNFLYDKKLFKSYRISKPVISIGNISTGGTGKSPFTVFLSGLLINGNYRPAIISRGYKRKSGEIEIVYDGHEIKGTVDKCGDEPVMMAGDLSFTYKDFYIVTCKNRIKTSDYVIDKFNPDLIILDDAFQHRKIMRDADIILIDAEDMVNNKFKNTFTIPSGNLREYLSNLSGADIIIQNNKFNNFEKLNKLYKFKKDIFILNYRIKGFYDRNNNETDIKGKEVCAFAGIAKPGSFFRKIKNCGCNIIDEISFRDHNEYDEDDISRIKMKANKETVYVTTEKDFVKIIEFGDFIKNFNVLFMKIELILDEQEKFLTLLKNFIPESK